MKPEKTTVTVSDIAVHARHGVLDQETKIGNDFLVNVSLDYDAVCAMKYDDIDHTVNYAQVVNIVRDVMAEPCRLIEHVAWKIANALTAAFPTVSSGTVSVTKVHPPFQAEVSGATFTIAFTA